MQFDKITFYKCFYCSKTYKIKENYKSHIIECELYNKMLSSGEAIPNQQTMFQLIKSLACKCNKLEKELNHLKGIVNIRKKKEILEWLNSEKKQSTSFTELYQNITVDEEDLKIVLENNLIVGLWKIIIKAIKKRTDNPIFCCTHKSNQLYLYDYHSEESGQKDEKELEGFAEEEPKAPQIRQSADMTCNKSSLNWKIGSNKEIENMILFLNNRFLQVFIDWKKENKEKFSMTEEGIHLEMMYMSRIMGFKIPLEKMVCEVKKELYKVLQENISSNYE